MPLPKAREMRKLKDDELEQKLSDYRKELIRLMTLAKRGTLGKESGKVKNIRRVIAMLETVKNERVKKG
ncbi:MAG: 50S ribosomal protein L29 [Conexivisphaerales archaeon]